MAILVVEGSDSELNDRWIYAARLKKLNTPEARAELKRMEENKYVDWTLEELKQIEAGTYGQENEQK